ncbi:RNase H domain-containing protein [Trichonephila clavipes]|nr:RNase H domain-containing protein [Trichonephila clavipes]
MQWLPGVIFQQDNARPHTARVSQDCLRTVTTLPWPARSPDLSPIEHIWDHLGRRVGHPMSLNELEARQLALEVINDIPDQALIIYTDGSRSDTGSGIFSNTPGNDVKISIRNPDHCSVFRSELIAISGALDHALNSYKDSIWILTDSRSSIQYLKNWPKIMDSTGLDILSKLVRLGQRKQVCLQWIPSHAGVPGNEAADELTGRGSKSPGLSIQCRSSRAHQTSLARLRSGHLRSMTFVQGVKSFFICPCSLLASPAHLLDCWGISLRQLYEEQGLVCETITQRGQMDLV